MQTCFGIDFESPGMGLEMGMVYKGDSSECVALRSGRHLNQIGIVSLQFLIHKEEQPVRSWCNGFDSCCVEALNPMGLGLC